MGRYYYLIFRTFQIFHYKDLRNNILISHYLYTVQIGINMNDLLKSSFWNERQTQIWQIKLQDAIQRHWEHFLLFLSFSAARYFWYYFTFLFKCIVFAKWYFMIDNNNSFNCFFQMTRELWWTERKYKDFFFMTLSTQSNSSTLYEICWLPLPVNPNTIEKN